MSDNHVPQEPQPVSADVARSVIEAEMKQKPPAPQPTRSLIPLDSKGRIAPTNHEELRRMCADWYRSGLVPKSMVLDERYQPLPAEQAISRIFNAAQMLRTLGVAPETNLRFVAMIKGTPSIFGDLPLTIVIRSRKMEGRLDEYLVNNSYERICLENKNIDDEVFAAVVRGKRRGQDAAVRTFSVTDAKRARLLPGKDGSVWSSYPKRMLQMRARGALLKDLFPDALAGMAITEYDFGPEILPEQVGLPAVHGRPKPTRGIPTLIDLNAAYPDAQDGDA